MFTLAMAAFDEVHLTGLGIRSPAALNTVAATRVEWPTRISAESIATSTRETSEEMPPSAGPGPQAARMANAPTAAATRFCLDRPQPPGHRNKSTRSRSAEWREETRPTPRLASAWRDSR